MRRIVGAAAAIAMILSLAAPAFAAVTLQVDPLEGGSTRDINFGSAKSIDPDRDPPLRGDVVVRGVKMTVASDSSGPYRIYQQVNEAWTNSTGGQLPLDSVLFSVAESSPQGTVRTPHQVPLVLGQQEIYSSDPSGKGTELVLNYTVKVPPGQDAGRYRMSVTYQVISQ